MALVSLSAMACNPLTSNRARGGDTDDAGDNYVFADGDVGGTPDPESPDLAVPNCTGLQCNQHACTNGVTTTISGKVYDPAGNNPLYNIVVFVPNTKPSAIKSGATCDACNSNYTGDPIAVALTDSAGHFVLKNAPDGANIPLVLQVGKWRKQMVLPMVTACVDNPQADKSLRLPRNHTEGDIPNIAISTGGADTLECLLVRVGIDETEYTPGVGGVGRIHIFAGGENGDDPPNTMPPGPLSSQSLWSSQAALMPYDLVLLSCEGSPTTNVNQTAMHAYTSAGGRVFASHYHYAWFDSGPFGNENLATWLGDANDNFDSINANIVTTFPKGMALKQWLTNVSGLTAGELPIQDARHNADAPMGKSPSQSWITADNSSPGPGAVEYFSFNTPTNAPANDAGVADYCGRVVYSDLHVGAASGDYMQGLGIFQTVPSGCATGTLSPQEKALEFMLFDLSSCVVPDDSTPQPPPTMGIM